MGVQSSSTFSFDDLRRLRNLPGRTVIWFGFLAVAMLAGTLVAQTALAHLLPTPQTLALAALDPRTEVLAVGSSRVLRGIDPALYSNTMVNLSLGGTSYTTIEPIVLRALKRAPNLKLVVVEVDVFLIRGNGYTIHWDTGYLYQMGMHPSDFPVSRSRRFIRYLTQPPVFLLGPLNPESLQRRSRARIRAWRLGFEPFTEWRSLADDPDYAGHGPEQFVRWHSHWLQEDHSVRTTECLLRLCRTLNARGVGVLLVRLPHLQPWLKGIPAEWNQQIETVGNTIPKEIGSGVWFYDLGESPGFDLSMFHDGLHFNDDGVRRFAALFNPIVSEACQWSERARSPSAEAFR